MRMATATVLRFGQGDRAKADASLAMRRATVTVTIMCFLDAHRSLLNVTGMHTGLYAGYALNKPALTEETMATEHEHEEGDSENLLVSCKR